MAETISIDHPEHTKIISLDTTAGRIEVGPAAAGKLQGLYLYSASEFRISRAASPVAEGGTAPSDDYVTIPASTRTPIGISPTTSGSDQVINIWVTSGTADVEILPYPVNR